MMDIQPPFEIEISTGPPDRRYELDCMPTVRDDGRFQPHLIVRTAETHEVLTDVGLEVGPYREAQDAAEVAYLSGQGWVRMFG
jgi:hypothetical protein